MSRTTRRRLPGYAPGERYYAAAELRHRPGSHPSRYGLDLDFRKNHWMHGRDAYGAKLAVSQASNRGPKGYCTYEEIWGLKGKRYAKRGAARVLRNRAKIDIRDAIHDLDDDY